MSKEPLETQIDRALEMASLSTSLSEAEIDTLTDAFARGELSGQQLLARLHEKLEARAIPPKRGFGGPYSQSSRPKEQEDGIPSQMIGRSLTAQMEALLALAQQVSTGMEIETKAPKEPVLEPEEEASVAAGEPLGQGALARGSGEPDVVLEFGEGSVPTERSAVQPASSISPQGVGDGFATTPSGVPISRLFYEYQVPEHEEQPSEATVGDEDSLEFGKGDSNGSFHLDLHSALVGLETLGMEDEPMAGHLQAFTGGTGRGGENRNAEGGSGQDEEEQGMLDEYDVEAFIESGGWEEDARDPGRILEDEGSLAIVLDLHYLQLAGASFSLQTDWEVAALEHAIQRRVGGVITSRYACDSDPDPDGKFGHGKLRLHAKLRTAGYVLALSPAKTGSRVQGATDVDVACCLFRAAGAFEPHSSADAIVLVAGDADFLPAVKAVLSARGPAAARRAWLCQDGELGCKSPDIARASKLGTNDDSYANLCNTSAGDGLRVVICAGHRALSRRYREALESEEGASIVSLDGLLGNMAPNVVDLRSVRRPRAHDGGTDVHAVIAALHEAHILVSRAWQATTDRRSDARAGVEVPPGGTAAPSVVDSLPLLTLHLSGPGGPAWRDRHMQALVDYLLGGSAMAAPSSVLSSLGQLWVHHTGLSDASCEPLAILIASATALRELHISDCMPGITIEGLKLLAAAAEAAGYGTSSSRPHRLYINARHLPLTPEAISVQKSYAQSTTLRLGGMRGPASAGLGRFGGGNVGGARGKGYSGPAGRGSPHGRGSPNGRGISGRGSPSTPKVYYSKGGSPAFIGRGAGGRGAFPHTVPRMTGRGRSLSPGGAMNMPVPAMSGPMIGYGRGGKGMALRYVHPIQYVGKGAGKRR